MTVNFFKDILRRTNRLIQYSTVRVIQLIGRCLYRHHNDIMLHPVDCENILVIRLDEIGDMVLMSPFLRELRYGCPNAHITLVVKPAVYNLVELCPYVDRVLTLSPIHGRGSFYIRIWKMFLFVCRRFKEQHFDMALVPRFDTDAWYGSGLLAFFSGAAQRIGYSEHVLPSKAISDRGFDGFYTEILQVESVEVRHEVERGCDFLRYLKISPKSDALEVWTSPEDEAEPLDILKKRSKDVSCIRIALFLCAGSSRREWPVSSFCETATRLGKDYPIEWVLMGVGEKDAERAACFSESVENVLNCVNMLTLRETAAMIQKCDVYLGGDTGPMHIAAALHKLGVVISCHPLGGDDSHVNSPVRFGPWRSENLSILRPLALDGCEQGCKAEEPHCITQVSVTGVEGALRQIFEGIH